MNRTSRPHRLICALQDLLPQAAFALVDCRNWHSMTFSGQILSIEAFLARDDHATVAERFATALPSHQFTIRSMVVADIDAVASLVEGRGTALAITALVIDE